MASSKGRQLYIRILLLSLRSPSCVRYAQRRRSTRNPVKAAPRAARARARVRDPETGAETRTTTRPGRSPVGTTAERPHDARHVTVTRVGVHRIIDN